MEERARLESIENDHRITRETDGAFLYTLQSALLLALKERGRLTEPQFRAAEQKLREQQSCLRDRHREGSGTQ